MGPSSGDGVLDPEIVTRQMKHSAPGVVPGRVSVSAVGCWCNRIAARCPGENGHRGRGVQGLERGGRRRRRRRRGGILSLWRGLGCAPSRAGGRPAGRPGNPLLVERIGELALERWLTWWTSADLVVVGCCAHGAGPPPSQGPATRAGLDNGRGTRQGATADPQGCGGRAGPRQGRAGPTAWPGQGTARGR